MFCVDRFSVLDACFYFEKPSSVTLPVPHFLNSVAHPHKKHFVWTEGVLTGERVGGRCKDTELDWPGSVARAAYLPAGQQRPEEPPRRDGGRGVLEVGVLRTALWDWDAGGRWFRGEPARFVRRKQALMMVGVMRTDQRGGFPHSPTQRTAAVTDINPHADFQTDA